MSGLRECRDSAMDLFAMVDERAARLVGPVLREILELRELGTVVPADGTLDSDEYVLIPARDLRRKVEVLLDALRLCCQINDEMGEIVHDMIGTLDELVAAGEVLSMKALAAELRPHLAVIDQPHGYTAAEYVSAVYAVRDAIELVPRERLLGGGLRAALGSGRHRLLTELLDVHNSVASYPCPSTGRADGGAEVTTPPSGASVPPQLQAVAC